MINLDKYNKMLEDLKQETRGYAILKSMKETLEKLKGGLKRCQKW